MRKPRFLLTLTGTLFLTLSYSNCLGQSTETKELQFLASGFSSNYQTEQLFDGVSSEQLLKYKFHPDLKIASLAAWAHCVRICNESEKADEQLLARGEFLGYLSGRMQCEIPDWWKSEVRALKPGQYRVDAEPRKYPEVFSISKDISHTKNISLETFSSREIGGKLDGVEFDFEWERRKTDMARRNNQEVGSFAVTRLKNGQFVWAVGGKGLVEFPVYCVDKDGNLLWKSGVEAVDNFGIAGSLNLNGYMDFRTNGKNIYLFGAVESGLFLVGFDSITGAKIFRLSTSFSP